MKVCKKSFSPKTVWLLYLLFFATLQLSAQDISIHHSRIKKSTNDTALINSYNFLAEYYLYENNDSAGYYCKKSIEHSTRKKKKNQNFRGYYLQSYLEMIKGNYQEALTVLKTARDIAIHNHDFKNEIEAEILKGNIYQQNKQSKQAIECYLNAYQSSRERKNKKGMIESGIYLGLYYKDINDNTEALKYYLKIYPIAIEIKDTSSIFNCCINIGTLYERTHDMEKALKFYRHALHINDADQDENGKAICYFKIGRLYASLHQNDSAEFYLNKTMEIHLKRKDELGLIFDYSYLASLYANQGDLKTAEENYNRSLDLAFKHKDSLRIGMVYDYKGTMHYNAGNNSQSLKNYLLCLQYAGKKMSAETLLKIYEKLADIHKRNGNYREALANYELFKKFTDSIYNVNDIKKQTELKLGFEFDQVEEKIKTNAREVEERLKASAREKEIESNAERERERQKRNYLIAGLILVSLLLFLAIRNFLNKQKANKILEQQKLEIGMQKKLVEEKNREISDSINYAHHIQTACLPERAEINSWFPDHGILFRPKDVVSGDFYWAAESGNTVLIAVADCTGHGVPGAITSMIGSMLLNEIFYVKNIKRPDEVLTELNRLVKLTLRQRESSTSKDGMDVAFCLWNKNTNRLQYSGANRPIYILRSGGSVEEIKSTKISIGGFTSLIQNYALHEIELKKGDTVVLSSDGYADQFGGKKEKKFTTKSFKSMLQEIKELSVEEQIAVMKNRLDDWQGNFSQTDDVLVFIFKV